MTRFVIGRVAGGLLTLLVSSMVVFAMVRFIPGDPITARLAEGGLSPEAQAALRKMYGFDQPLVEQYWSWLSAIVQGNFGSSLTTHTPVIEDLLTRIPRTIYLALAGIFSALVLAVPTAIITARYPGGRLDSLVTTVSGIFVAVPNFVIGIILIIVFAVQLKFFPVAGYIEPSADPLGFAVSIVLPALTVGLPASAVIVRVLRSSLLDELRRDYVRTAEARGASRLRAITRHTLRNASLPTVTIVGLQIGQLLGGAIVVETLFSYPGVGLLLLNSITQRDYPVVQACLLFLAFAFVVVNLATDVLYAALNPKLKVGR
ncbi:peptide/nickel transport system permease protein [Amycolatopsis sacchari]|uniref:Peptide/nickel transport system permease protein n=1 Tax=Amycolatopsis sacchari TaxID=115433 RepID=A0A1I3UYM9_9PSEU|nr:ABC transporter permease [Amycolatopsis sacchari]SFJ88524.1 peptide/nickel transport system permease protein [Amycolatopsis sacchari]